jgi:hypothetical protein
MALAEDSAFGKTIESSLQNVIWMVMGYSKNVFEAVVNFLVLILNLPRPTSI